MKTEQEQIEKMARTMCGYCSTDGKCAVSKNGREPDICANVDTQHCLYKEYAERLIESGYGDVSEYKAEREMLGSQIKVLKQRLNNKYVEIEQLKSDFKQLQTNAEILARGVRDFNHENYELTEKVKQAQTDTINTIIKYCENPNHWRELKDCKLFGGKSDDLRNFLNGIFKEVEK